MRGGGGWGGEGESDLVYLGEPAEGWSHSPAHGGDGEKEDKEFDDGWGGGGGGGGGEKK